MKKTSLILNIVALVAIAVLYVLHFAQSDEKNTTTSHHISGPATPVAAAYVNLDSLLSNLDQYYDLRNGLMAKQKDSQMKLDSRAKSFETSVRDLDEQMKKGLITRSNAMKAQENLQKEEQNILMMREELTYKLAEEEQVMNRTMMNDIVNYIEEYNKDKNYQFVINTAFGGTLLYGDDSMNITNDIIEGMNAKYGKEKSKK